MPTTAAPDLAAYADAAYRAMVNAAMRSTPVVCGSEASWAFRAAHVEWLAAQRAKAESA